MKILTVIGHTFARRSNGGIRKIQVRPATATPAALSAHLGMGEFGCCKVSVKASVQSPAARMWTEKKFSSGAEVRVNGCHSR